MTYFNTFLKKVYKVVEEKPKLEIRPAPSFFPTNKDLGIIVSDDAGSIPPIPSFGGKE